jgi:hypothetical protein
VYSALTQWIVDNTSEWKIKFVLGVGDCMNTTGSGERAIATTALRPSLDASSVPPQEHDPPPAASADPQYDFAEQA